MINRFQMFVPLLKADHSFQQRWQEFLADYSDQAELPLYIALGDYADHLIQRLRRGDTDGFHMVFATVENWHTDGDAYVSEAASIGFLESLQNRLGGNDRSKNCEGIRASDFEPWFGPETRKWWDKLYRFWEGDTDALRFDS